MQRSIDCALMLVQIKANFKNLLLVLGSLSKMIFRVNRKWRENVVYKRVWGYYGASGSFRLPMTGGLSLLFCTAVTKQDFGCWFRTESGIYLYCSSMESLAVSDLKLRRKPLKRKHPWRLGTSNGLVEKQLRLKHFL